MLSFKGDKSDTKIAIIDRGRGKPKDILYLVKDDNSDGLKEIKIKKKDDKLFPLPIKSSEYTEKLYICGPSGSGKSTFTGKWIKYYLKMFKEHEFYLFSRVCDDQALDNQDPIRIPLDEEFIMEPYSCEDLGDSVCVFDDCGSITNKHLNLTVQALQDDILETGRHNDITCVVTSHNIMNWKQTRKILNESTSVVLFPKAGSKHGIKQFLTKYMGMDKKEQEKLLKLPSRWVYIHKRYPNYIIYEKGAYMI